MVSDIAGIARYTLCMEADLLRYLRARNFKATKAEPMLRASVKWRAEYGADWLSYAPLMYENRTGCKLVLTTARDGTPVMVIRPRDNPPDTDADTQVKLVIYTMEKCVQLLPKEHNGKMYQIMDLADWTLAESRRAPFSKSMETLNIMQNQFPERLGKLFTVNAPRWFSWFYKALSPFLSAETKAKIVFINGDMATQRQLFSPYIAPDMLPELYGGDLKLQFDPDAYAKRMLILDLQARARLAAQGFNAPADVVFDEAVAKYVGAEEANAITERVKAECSREVGAASAADQ
eukprot:TRINITY_DN172_c0_g1_i1.p1 TRINITY_DN172_c0_g1~~TRINITY_DN172_c0_g1_i1.p1  ORF type:complete len:291 (+),score=56.26 TRINITY_DN172_c0_g1_i1:269-1141(+)